MGQVVECWSPMRPNSTFSVFFNFLPTPNFNSEMGPCVVALKALQFVNYKVDNMHKARRRCRSLKEVQ